MGFEANGVPGGGTPGGGDLTGTLIAGRIPVANGIKSLTSSDSTYVGGVLTLKAAGSLGKVTIDGSGITTIDGFSTNINSSSGFITLASAQQIYITSSATLGNRAIYLDSSNRLSSAALTTGTDINNLSGTTGNIQTQIDNKLGGSLSATFLPYAINGNTLANSASYQTSTALILNAPAGGAANVQLNINNVNINGNQIVLSTSGLGNVSLNAGTSGGFNIRLVGTNLTPSTVPYIDSGNLLISSAVTPTELGYVSGATSNLQTQISAKMTNPMTQIGDMIQGSTSGTPVRIASVATGNVLLSGGVTTANLWGKVGLTTHVTGILTEANGGTGTNVIATSGSIPFQGGSSAYTYDYANFNYNSAIKTLNTYAMTSNPGSGIIAYKISTLDSMGIDIITGGGGVNIVNTSGSVPSIQISNTGVGPGIAVDNTSGIAGSFTSKLYTAGLFAQTGSLIANNTSDGVVIYRNFSLNAFTSTGALLNLNDDTAASGNFLTVTKQSSTKLVIKSTGVLQYIDGNQAATKVLTSDASGNASWQTAAGGGSSYTFSTGLTNNSGIVTNNLSTGFPGSQFAVGGTAPGENLTLMSTASATKGKIYFGNSVYNEANTRLGINMALPSATVDIGLASGATGFRLLNNAATAAASVDVGWYWSVVTNGTDTNIEVYEQNAASGLIKREVYHKGGNRTFGPGSGNGDAKVHVIGTLKVQDGSEGVGKIFTSDSTGLGSWTTAGVYTGTTNRITVTGTVIDISASYIGQSSITTLGTITTGTWNATKISEIYGGTNQNAYTTGDMLYASATNTLSKLAAVSTGSYLRSAGTTTAPVWSTLKLPNTATNTRVVHATATNTWGENANFTYDGFWLTVGPTSGSLLNGDARINIYNPDSGGSASSVFFAYNGSNYAQMQIIGVGATPGGQAFNPGLMKLQTDNAYGMVFQSVTPSTYFSWFVGDNTDSNEIMRATTTGLYIGNQTNPSARLHLKAGTTTIAPIRLVSGTNKTTAAAGEIEYNGTNFFATRTGTTRETLMTGVVSTGTYTPSTTTVVTTNINGTTYNLVTA